MTKRGKSRKKAEEPEVEVVMPEPEVKEPRPRRMPRASTGRELVDPTTGDKIYLEPYDQYPEGFKYFAKLMYISGNMSLSQVACRLQVPTDTVKTWSKRENWTLLKREVNRLANKEMIKIARKSMSNYIKDIDRGLNDLLVDLQVRRKDADKKIDSEAAAMRFILEVLKIKLQMFRTLTYGVQGKAFTPHPSNLIFDGMEDRGSSLPLTNNAIEDIMDGIPEVLKDSARFVLGMDIEDLDPAVVDAVAIYLDAEEEDEADDNPDLILED
jgi:hypothetical protein